MYRRIYKLFTINNGLMFCWFGREDLFLFGSNCDKIATAEDEAEESRSEELKYFIFKKFYKQQHYI